MIILYLLLILSIGVNFYVILKHFKIIKEELNIYEIISLICTSGFIIFTIYVFILGIIGFSLKKYIFIPIFLSLLTSLAYIIYLIKQIKFKFIFQKKDLLNIIIYSALIFANLNLLVYFITKAISTKLIYPDEFSVWGLNAKNIFIGKKLTLFMNTGLENYPNFLPLIYSGFYIFIGRVEENWVRILPVIFLIINLINMIGIADKLKIDKRLVLLGNLFIISLFTSSYAYSTSLYSEYPFMTMYTIGIEYLLLYLFFQKSNEILLISAINMLGACWCRQDGLYLFAFNIFVLVFAYMFWEKINIKKISLKEMFIYIIGTLSVPISWKLWTIIAHYPKELAFGAGSKIELHLEFIVPLFENITKQFFNDIPSTILLGLIILGLIFKYNNLKKREKLLVVFNILACLANFTFLILCYLFVFGGEALVAASFIRYYSRIIMINLIIVFMLWNKEKRIINVENK